MADAKISALTAQTTGGIAPTDLFVSVDVSDGTMASTGTDKKATYQQITGGTSQPGPSQYVDGTNGSDTNDGLSWAAPRLTTATAIAYLEAQAGGVYLGDLYLSRGPQNLATQLVVPSSISVHGNKRRSGFGFETLYDAGSWFVWTGSNPGSAGLTTGSVIQTASFDRGGVLEDFAISIPGAAMTNLRALDMKDWQNGSSIRNVLISGTQYADGFVMYNTASTGAPGYFNMNNCWVYNGAVRPYVLSGGVEVIRMTDCALDDGVGATAYATAGIRVGASGISNDVFPGGASLSLDVIGFKNEMGGVSTGDYPDIRVDANYDCRLTVFATYQQSNFTTAGGLTTPAIDYQATPSMTDDDICGIPVSIMGYSSQTRAILISAPNAVGGALTLRTDTAPASGMREYWSYDRANRAGDSIIAIAGSPTIRARTTLISASAGARTPTLPTAVGCRGLRKTISKSDSSGNTVTIGTTSAQTINGVTTKVLSTQYATVTVISDGANWLVV